jgi:hypothetical protein
MDMKKTRSSFQMQWNDMQTHILFAVRSPVLTDSIISSVVQSALLTK